MIDIEATVREYIAKTLHMSLGTSANNIPWVCEVHFAYDDQLNLYFRSKPSRRHSQEIAANPHVAGNIVAQHSLNDSVVGIYFEGSAEMLNDVSADHPAYVSMSGRGIAGPDTIEDSQKDEGHKFYKITVKNWYAFGRFDESHGQKYTLEWNK